MSCFHPMKAERSSDGSVRFLSCDAKVFNLRLPCGRCIGCRLERSRQWAVRCMHEAQLHDQSCFVTLTYDDVHLAGDHSLRYRDFQLFLKRLRRAVSPVRFRFYMCGEYGDDFSRPHFHACLFGLDFSDKTFFKKDLFRSAFLESVWPFGYSTVGALTFESASYVARYVMKKVTGNPAEAHYEFIVPETGEIVNRVPEFNCMSRKPGIGSGWFDLFSSDVFPSDEVIFNGHESKPPRFYDRCLKRVDRELFDSIKIQRVEKAKLHLYDSCSARLVVREQVVDARLASGSKRKL